MNAHRTVLAAAALLAAAVLPSAGVATACEEEPQAPIRAAEVQSELNRLLASEGLGATRVGQGVVRQVDLDGNAQTAEALVDVVAPEHCFGTTCLTLVVRRAPDGSLRTAGHGVWLVPLASRSNGWVDLGATAPIVTVKALRFTQGRYR